MWRVSATLPCGVGAQGRVASIFWSWERSLSRSSLPIVEACGSMASKLHIATQFLTLKKLWSDTLATQRNTVVQISNSMQSKFNQWHSFKTDRTEDFVWNNLHNITLGQHSVPFLPDEVFSSCCLQVMNGPPRSPWTNITSASIWELACKKEKLSLKLVKRLTNHSYVKPSFILQVLASLWTTVKCCLSFVASL